MGISFMKFKIKINNFNKKYQNEEVKIDDLTINKRVTLLVGKNGSGKSTLLRAISGLIKYGGEIKVDGKVSYMSEFPHFPIDLEVSEFINSLNQISKYDISEKEVNDLYNLFKLNDKTNVLLSSLSKGMKAKVNLVQALMEPSDIYLLDEPLSGLDDDGVKCLIKYISESTKSFVISTHLLDDFKEISDEVISL